MKPQVFQPNQKVRGNFIKWLESGRFDARHVRSWAHRYNADAEAAMCEAAFWDVLSGFGVEIEPNADLSQDAKMAPDFRCRVGEKKFYVEVTCIRTDTATRKTGLPPVPERNGGTQHYSSLNNAIVAECKSKTLQCSGLDAPCLLAIGTFHFQATILGCRPDWLAELLTGETSIGWIVDQETGRAIGDPYQATSFRSAAFTRKTLRESIEHVRHPISGLLIGGFGSIPAHVFGLLHPSPVREFDPRILPQVPFGRQRLDLTNGTVRTEWIQTPDDWERQQ